MKIAIIGHGFVGKAVDYAFQTSEKYIVDPIYPDSLKIEDLRKKADIAACFVCVPTPMGDDGSIDSSIVIKTVKYLLNKVAGIIVIKSTVTPDVIKKLSEMGNGNRIVFNPEFLTEKNANEDFVNSPFHIFGGLPETTKRLEDLYKEHSLCKQCPSHHMSATDAGFVKYGVNCFLASKVLWFNQFYDVVENFGGNFTHIINAITGDERIGHSHSRVPGFDGKRGYGGACFPKDTAAFSNFAKTFNVLDLIIDENNLYRTEYEKDARELAQNVKYD